MEVKAGLEAAASWPGAVVAGPRRAPRAGLRTDPMSPQCGDPARGTGGTWSSMSAGSRLGWLGLGRKRNAERLAG